MMAILVGIVILLASACVKAFESPASVKELWSPIMEIRQDCPRFVAVAHNDDGLGDQLERLFVALSLVWSNREYGITLAVSNKYGGVSTHGHTYRDAIFNVMGVPRSLPHIETVMATYKPKLQTLRPGVYGEYITGQRNFSRDLQCNSIVSIDIYDACNGQWCPLLWLDQISEGLGNLLHDTYRLNGAFCSNNGPVKYRLNETSPNTVRLVWHMRLLGSRESNTTHQCRACNPEYLLRVNNFITDVIGNASTATSQSFKREDIFVHRHVANLPSPLDSLLPLHMTSEDLGEVLCSFATADVLLALGSSLPCTFAYFLPRDRPLIVEEFRMISEQHRLKGYKGGPIPFQYITPRNRSFHLADGWPGEGADAMSVAQALLKMKKKLG